MKPLALSFNLKFKACSKYDLVDLLLYVHGKHMRSSRDSQLS